jgi:ParB-like chromosome segregation protein Spo0J
MAHSVKSTFRPEVVVLEISRLLPSRSLDPRERTHQKYRQIAASITAVGLIEPLVVFPTTQGRYRVLDGHKRLEILAARKAPKVQCLIATDDESYTYNKRVNYLSPVGEHKMILRALEHNSEQRIAEALSVNIDTIRRKRDLLEGICKEAVDLLKDRRVAPKAFAALRKMRPLRQVEAAQLMRASNIYSARFTNVLLMGTRVEMLIEPDRNATAKPASADKLRMEQETDSLLRNLEGVEASYGTEVLTLSISCRYVDRMLANGRIRGYLQKHHPEIARELETLVASVDTGATLPGHPTDAQPAEDIGVVPTRKLPESSQSPALRPSSRRKV